MKLTVVIFNHLLMEASIILGQRRDPKQLLSAQQVFNSWDALLLSVTAMEAGNLTHLNNSVFMILLQVKIYAWCDEDVLSCE